MDVVRDFSPFGWSVGRGGRKPAQVREDVRTMVEGVTDRWTAVFPERDGYRVTISSPAGASNGVRLSVVRGNFRASVGIESILDPARRTGGQQAIRMFGRAEATSLVVAEQVSHRSVRRLRQVGMALSGGLFFSFLWVIAGAQSGAYILAALLTMVAGIMMTTVGASLGGYLGEWVAEKARRRALNQTSEDKLLQDDLRRWRALSRELSSSRQALQGQPQAGPFRALSAGQVAVVGATRASMRPPSRPLPKLATSSFSFSSS